jgi:hypothetical protein
MTNRKTLKETITSAVVLQLPNTYSDFNGIPVDKLLFKWWFTGRSDGLRLTEFGDSMFRLAEIECYTFDFQRRTDMSDHAYMLELTKKIKCPYYLGVNKSEDKKKIPYIKLYDSKIAMLISLYGTLVEYLNSIKVKS